MSGYSDAYHEPGPRIDLARTGEMRAGPLVIHPSLCEVELDGERQKLEPRVMQVLVALASAGGALVSRDDLIRSCWAGAIVGDDAINRVLVQLRRLARRTGGAVRIETVRSLGYRLIIAAPAKAEGSKGQASRALRTRALMGLGAAGVLVAAVLASSALLSPTQTRPRIAVLPFRAETSELGSHADTITQRIRGALSLGDLETIARVRTEDYEGTRLQEVAARDRIALVLEGTVRREGPDLLALVEVVDARRNVTVWSREYRRALSEEVWLEEQIAAHSAEVLRCALVTGRSPGPALEGEALAGFIRACDRIAQFEAGGADMLTAGRELTQSAPRASRAWSMLAMAAAMTARYESPTRAGALRREAERAAARALELDRRNGESLLARAILAPQDDFAERDALTLRALQIDPSLSDAHITRAFLLMEMGRTSEALSHAREASALDPLAPVTWITLVPILSANGQDEEARRIGERLLRVWPDSPAARFNTFKNRMFNGAPREALAILDEGRLPLHPEVQPALRVFLQALIAGDAQRARGAARALADLAKRGYYDPPSAISSASLSGDLDLAFELADFYLTESFSSAAPTTPARAATSHFMFLSPTANMRRDRRFMALAARAGLADYWRRRAAWPDFCHRPDLPYDCVAEAASYSDPAPSSR